MMMMSKEMLLQEAKKKGYKPEILEKVYQLLPVLHQHELPRSKAALGSWLNQLVKELEEGLSSLLPLNT